MNFKKIYEIKETPLFSIFLIIVGIFIKLFYDLLKLLVPILNFIFGTYGMRPKILEGYKYINLLIVLLGFYILIRYWKYFRNNDKNLKRIILLNLLFSLLLLITYAFSIRKVDEYYFLTRISLYDPQISNDGYDLYLLFVNELYTIFSIVLNLMIGFLCRRYYKNYQMEEKI